MNIRFDENCRVCLIFAVIYVKTLNWTTFECVTHRDWGNDIMGRSSCPQIFGNFCNCVVLGPAETGALYFGLLVIDEAGN